MSICVPPTLLYPISLCTDAIVIGTISNANTHVKVNFKNVANGAIYSYPAQSNGAGLITLTLTDGMPLASGQYYELSVSSTTNINDVKTLTIGTTAVTCYLFSADTIFDLYYSDHINFTSQTLEVDAS
jgi:hypothetical protein